MQIKKLFLLLSVFFVCFQTSAQQFSGTITNTSLDPLENARIILQYPNEVKENDTVYSDATGYYNIGQTNVGINDIKNNNDEISYRITGNILHISIRTDAINRVSKSRSTGKLFSLQGKLISQCLLMKTAPDTYAGQIQLNRNNTGMYIFSDGYNSIKIPILNNRYTYYSNCSEAEPVEGGLATYTGFDKLNLRTSRHNRSLSLSKADSHYHLIISHTDYQPTDSTLENINPSQTYTYDFSLHYTNKTFPRQIISKNNLGELINVDYEVRDAIEDTLITTGNTGVDGEATFDINTEIANGESLDVDIFTTSASGDEELLNAEMASSWNQEEPGTDYTINDIATYPFNMTVIGEHSGNGNIQDSITVRVYDENEFLLGEECSLENTSVNFDLGQLVNQYQLKVITEREQFENDTTEFQLDKTNQTFTKIASLDTIINPTIQGKYRARARENTPQGITIKTVFESQDPTIVFKDSIENLTNLQIYEQDLPTKESGTTTYKITYICTDKPEDANIVDTAVVFREFQPGETIIAEDIMYRHLTQKVQGWVKLHDVTGPNNPSGSYEITRILHDGTIIDTQIIPAGENFSFENIVGEEGEGPEYSISIKPIDDANTHFGLYKMPLTTKEMSLDDIAALGSQGDVQFAGRPIIIPEKITQWSDTIQYINFMLTQRNVIAPLDNVNVEINPYHILMMEGEGINSEDARYDTINVYLGTNILVADYMNSLNHIRNLFGHDFNQNYVDEVISNQLSEDYSLQNDNNKINLGFNVRDGPNSTTNNTYVIEGIPIILGGDVEVSPEDTIGFIREMMVRVMGINTVSGVRPYASIYDATINPSLTVNLSEGDQANGKIFLKHRPEQVKADMQERVFNNLGYLRKAENFFNGQSLQDMYGLKAE